MAKQEAPLEYLKRYIPEASAAPILHYLNVYKVHLTITRERRSVLGDYRHATHYKNHRISINGNLNPYSFLITLIHEMAPGDFHKIWSSGCSTWKRMEGNLCDVAGGLFKD